MIYPLPGHSGFSDPRAFQLLRDWADTLGGKKPSFGQPHPA